MLHPGILQVRFFSGSLQHFSNGANPASASATVIREVAGNAILITHATDRDHACLGSWGGALGACPRCGVAEVRQHAAGSSLPVWIAPDRKDRLAKNLPGRVASGFDTRTQFQEA